MTALPLRDFTAAEQAHLAAIEAAPAADESVRERVARALYDADPDWTTVDEATPWAAWTVDHDWFRRLADAVLAVLRGPSSDAEQAVERCLALADLHAECSQFVAVWDLRRAAAGD